MVEECPAALHMCNVQIRRVGRREAGGGDMERKKERIGSEVSA